MDFFYVTAFGAVWIETDKGVRNMGFITSEEANNQFLKYEGDIKGTMAKSMIQEVLATNAESANNDNIQVTVNSEDSPITSNITNTNTYNVELEYDTASGRVKNILLTTSSGASVDVTDETT